jgi:hypothetical protein
MILWVDDRRWYEQRPPQICRLEARGLEVLITDDFGPHKKYYPYLLQKAEFNEPLVTADDDALYSSWWLKGLVDAHSENPRVINCYRARVIQVAGSGLAAYQCWNTCRSSVPSFLNCATGVSGCIYPAAFLKLLKGEGSEFRNLCLRADDVWLHRNAIRHGFAIRQVFSRHMEFPSIPGTQDNGLFKPNQLGGENDEYVRNVYSSSDIETLSRSALIENIGRHTTGFVH